MLLLFPATIVSNRYSHLVLVLEQCNVILIPESDCLHNLYLDSPFLRIINLSYIETYHVR